LIPFSKEKKKHKTTKQNKQQRKVGETEKKTRHLFFLG
jgi:hypothetical protein